MFYKLTHSDHDFRKVYSKCRPPRWMLLLLEVIDHSFALIMWDGLNLVLNCVFQVSDRLLAILIHSVLEKTPQMEVKGVQVGAMGSPVIFIVTKS